MRHSHHMLRSRSGERGSTMIEAVICMLIICLILFGLLQIFYITAAQMITDYSAFRAARSETVGFNEEIVEREGRLKAIAASGRICRRAVLLGASRHYRLYGNAPDLEI